MRRACRTSPTISRSRSPAGRKDTRAEVTVAFELKGEGDIFLDFRGRDLTLLEVEW